MLAGWLAGWCICQVLHWMGSCVVVQPASHLTMLAGRQVDLSSDALDGQLFCDVTSQPASRQHGWLAGRLYCRPFDQMCSCLVVQPASQQASSIAGRLAGFFC